MTNQNDFILDAIDPDLGERIDMGKRSLFLRRAVPAALLASAPLVLAAASTEAFAAGGLPQKVVDVLNFALTLEYLEAAFYKAGNSSNGLIPSKYRALFRTIGQHETAHVALLQHALGSAAVKAPKVDFTAGGKYADVFSNFETFATLSATFEDLGVAAYKGQAGNLAGTPVLTTALQIHSVEARHASAVRPLVGKAGYISAFDKPKTKKQVLAAATPFLA
ncbi:MAG: ferritin-like domain-containing protein [Devosia sp.]